MRDKVDHINSNQPIWVSFLILFLLFFGSCSTYTEQAAPLLDHFEIGPYKTGFAIEEIDDQLEVSIWYPAIPGDKKQRTFAEYLVFSEHLLPTENFEKLTDERIREVLSNEMNPYAKSIEPEKLDQILNMYTYSWEGLERAEGTYPVLIWSARNGTSIGQSVLNEYLASHGFILIYGRDPNIELTFPWELQSDSIRLYYLAEHLKDLHQVLDYAKTLKNADTSQIGVLSWSYGGESATLLKNTRKEVKLMVSLSSNVLSGWVFQVNDTLDSFNPSAVKGPVLQIMEKREDFQITQLWRQVDEGLIITTDEGNHGNFNAIESYIPSYAGIEEVPMWSVGGEVGLNVYPLVGKLTRHYLEDQFELKDHNLDSLFNLEPVTVTPFRNATF